MQVEGERERDAFSAWLKRTTSLSLLVFVCLSGPYVHVVVSRISLSLFFSSEIASAMRGSSWHSLLFLWYMIMRNNGVCHLHYCFKTSRKVLR